MHRACDLLVTSTDRFLPEARITMAQLDRLGIASRFDCHLLLGEANPRIEGFKVLHRARQGSWSSELRDGLLQLDKPFVLLWLDDFPPLRSLPVDDIVALIDRFIALDGHYLRLNPTPAGLGQTVQPGLRAILPNELYRTSTVYAVWRRSTLLSLLDDTETAWQFEFAGSERSARFNGFYASEKSHVEFVNLVIKGLIDPRAERRLRSMGVEVSGLVRARMNRQQLQKLQFGELRSWLLKQLPCQLRTSVRNLFSTNPSTRR